MSGLVTASIRCHMEINDSPELLDWVVLDGYVQGHDIFSQLDRDPAELPQEVFALFEEGVVSELTVQNDRLTFRKPLVEISWNEIAPRIQQALLTVFSRGEHIQGLSKAKSSDELIADGVQDLLDGEVGVLVDSHRGKIDLVAVENGVVKLHLQGACKGCTSAGKTLKIGIEQRLRRRFPQLRAVESVFEQDELDEQRVRPAGRSFLGLSIPLRKR